MRLLKRKLPLTLDRYKSLKEDKPKDPKEVLQAKMSKRDKLKALVEIYEAPNAPKPNPKMFKDLDMSRVDARGIKLNKLGPDVIREITWNGADLSGQDFSGMNLRGIRMRGAKLHGTRMPHNMENADMAYASTGSTSFKNTNANGSNVEGMNGVAYVGHSAWEGVKGTENLLRADGVAHVGYAPRPKGGKVRALDPYRELKEAQAAAAMAPSAPAPQKRRHAFPVLAA
ncbi:MAG TPA: hypothetical protein DD400_03500 [Rhodospirillaceae bacterium]|nr:hypothetical protein [Rhodospirillaceae bacterium]